MTEKLTPLGSLTPQRVAGALKRAGFDASKGSTTGIRGWKDYSEGFRTSLNYPRDGSIIVSYHTGGHHSRPNHEMRQLDKLLEALQKDGFDVRRVGGVGAHLVVKLKTEDSTT